MDSIQDLLEAGAHFGHQSRYWNPKMKKYIYGTYNHINIINLEHTLIGLRRACEFVHDLARDRKKLLLVGTKKAASDIIKEEALAIDQYYVNHRWMGGTLTNYNIICASIDKLNELTKQKQEGMFEKLTKKEAMMRSRAMMKLERNIGGIKDMNGLPDALFVVDVRYERIAVAEANKLGIPVIGIVDSNSSPDNIDFVIPGNDDSIRSISLLVKAISGAFSEGGELAEQYSLMRADKKGKQAAQDGEAKQKKPEHLSGTLSKSNKQRDQQEQRAGADNRGNQDKRANQDKRDNQDNRDNQDQRANQERKEQRNQDKDMQDNTQTTEADSSTENPAKTGAANPPASDTATGTDSGAASPAPDAKPAAGSASPDSAVNPTADSDSSPTATASEPASPDAGGEVAISASAVKELRQMSGAGIMECKKALKDAQGDLNKAADLLRESGLAKQLKRADRSANEGAVAVRAVGGKAIAVEINCETDFVARNRDFVDFAERVAEAFYQEEPQLDGDTPQPSTQVAEDLQQLSQKMGEKLVINKYLSLAAKDGGSVGAYVHTNGKLCALVAIDADEPQLARDLAMQVAAMAPQVARPEEVPQELLDKEKEIFLAQIKDEQKPEEIKQKMIAGKLKKFAAEISLSEQSFFKDPDKKISGLLKEAGVTEVKFLRHSIAG